MKALIYLVCIFPLMLNAQISGTVTYFQFHSLPSMNDYKGQTVLQFNGHQSNYIQVDLPDKDIFEENNMSFSLKMADKEGFPIFIDKKKMQYVQKTELTLSNTKCIFQDTLQIIAWELVDSSRTIGNYQAQKAIGQFSGRTYEAWYTLDIPVNAGPHKLWGLPGLILEAHSLDGKITFLAKKVKVGTATLQLNPPTEKLSFTSKKALALAKEESEMKFVMKIKSMGGQASINPHDKEAWIEKDFW